MKIAARVVPFLVLAALSGTVCGQRTGARRVPIRAAEPVWQWRCEAGDSLLNYNPAVVADSNHVLTFDSVLYAREYTMVVVYKPVVPSEASVWNLMYGGGEVRGLTTEYILSDSLRIHYTDTTFCGPVINTLRQSAPDSTGPYVRLTLGGGALTGRIKVCEVLYFDRRLGTALLRRVQSALALRYGVTLGPVDYVDVRGNLVWDYGKGGYHHRVAGVGRDSIYGLSQLRSRSESDGALLTVETDSLDEGSYLVCGDDDGPLEFMPGDKGEILGRTWRVRTSQGDSIACTLTFDTHGFSVPGDSLFLITDGGVYLPDSVSSGTVIYRDVVFRGDTSVFTLARGWEPAHPEGKSGGSGSFTSAHDSDGTLSATMRIYPNPTVGEYTVEVQGVGEVRVDIYNAQGTLMETFQDSGKRSYRFRGSLPPGNVYYATVTSGERIQTMKLIVK